MILFLLNFYNKNFSSQTKKTSLYYIDNKNPLLHMIHPISPTCKDILSILFKREIIM